ncbi:DeoR family transcriptional regulator [Microtetraspora sp. NBRC 13810]|uniref:DeoR/GlpR family DNA-binding transcription regulator n=1 Tax=Microtetraspora sp. NBRC 13810 TaxID=3030990 RepID=UPI0024A3C2BC|nr:DeoR/GlpR family DNA-binding transcription regulator [Microtetraspora sp. NBRC 13810]GLW10918.1 DeoR family transcriptional regulator [Microtetraspora sp. NBRC 13810]
MKAEQRRARIGNLLQAHPVTVEEMATMFAVSPSTIRRDLAELSCRGAIVRTYGGALSAAPGEQSVRERERLARAHKAAIAKVAEGHVRQGALLLLDAGTTVGALAQRLATWSGITVVTNGLTTVDALADSEGVELVALGGAVRHVSLGMIGPIAEGALRCITADVAFIGGDGVVADRGVCEGTAEQAALKRLMVERARDVYVLADSTKLGLAGGHWWTTLDRPWTLVTDSEADPERLAPFRACPGVTVEIASL